MRVHFIGIGGRAMGGIAVALARAGHVVSGSDHEVYDPMRGFLVGSGIAVTAYDPQCVPADANAIVVGKRVTDDNPELQWVRQQRLPYQSFPSFLRERFLLRSRNAVVAGGVGKTTTTAMLAWVLEEAGLRPDYLIGGLARNFELPARFSGAAISVLEGDEYGSGPGDTSAKLLHYAPEVVAITNLLVDHPDLYADRQGLLGAFIQLVRLLPAHGQLVLSTEEAATDQLADVVSCRVVRVGTGGRSDLRMSDARLTTEDTSFALSGVPFRLPMTGVMNIRNAALAVAAATHFGVSLKQSSVALERFAGLPNHQEAQEAGPFTLVRDKASHPQSMAELCRALRQKYPDRRLVVVIQPRATGGRRWIYQRDLPEALSGFDRVVLTAPYEHKPAVGVVWEHEPFSLDMLAGALQSRGAPVAVAPTLQDVPLVLLDILEPGDVVLLSLREQFADQWERIARTLAEQAMYV